MTLKSIKISDENYHWLSALAGELQQAEGRPVSLDETLRALRSKKLRDLAGSWTMSDEEAADMEKRLREGWRKWKHASA